MQEAEKIAVAVLGGTGYGAGELLRFLTIHPQIEVSSVVSSSKSGEEIEATHGFLSGFYPNKRYDAKLDLEKLQRNKRSVIFFALPHGKSPQALAEISSKLKNTKVIDLAGDFRLRNRQDQSVHYPEALSHSELASSFVYGLPEVARSKIEKASKVANPGCLSTACALAVLPLADSKFEGPVVFDAKTGSSGGGRSLAETMHHPYRHSNINAYKVLEHRHEPEIRETLGDSEGNRISTIFVPHLLPISRGIMATAYLTLAEPLSTDQLREKYKAFYRDSMFIRIRDRAPDLEAVVGSNFCDISVFARGKQVVAISALDNLVKGMVGTAIQNMNLMFSLPEDMGLMIPSLPLS